MLSVHNLSCIRNNQTLFSQLSFSLSPGKVLHIVGENGSGKSSLLSMLTGMLMPSAGEIYWNKTPIHASADYASQLAFVGHKVGVRPQLTVLENLQFAVALNNRRMSKMALDAVLEGFNIASLKHTLCEKLSAGQRQKVALCRLLITDALLWVLDEPFTAIDQAGVGVLQRLISEHSAREGMVVLTSHQALQLEGEENLRLTLNLY